MFEYVSRGLMLYGSGLLHMEHLQSQLGSPKFWLIHPRHVSHLYLLDIWSIVFCISNAWHVDKRNHWCLATNIHMPYAKAVHLKGQRRILWVGSYLAQDFWDNLSWIATTMHFTTLANPNTCIIYLGHSRVLLQATSWLHEPGSYMMSFE